MRKDYDEFWERLETKLREHERSPSWSTIGWNILFWAVVMTLVLLAFAIATGALV